MVTINYRPHLQHYLPKFSNKAPKYTFLPTITARQFKFKIFDQDHCKIIDQKCFLENIFFAKSVPSKRDKKMVNFGTFLYQ